MEANYGQWTQQIRAVGLDIRHERRDIKHSDSIHTASLPALMTDATWNLPANEAHTQKKVVVLGASGMFGHTLLRVLAEDERYAAVGTSRRDSAPRGMPPQLSALVMTGIDAADETALIRLFETHRPEAVINCVGLVKQREEAQSTEAMIRINALLPHVLARVSALYGTRLVHLSTDCVFDGRIGHYREDCPATATDLYGRSKLLGEVSQGGALTLRTSIIGPELDTSQGLLEWFLGQRAAVRGFGRAIFSGLPTVELARVVRDFVLPDATLSGLYNVAAAPIAKFDLLVMLRAAYGHQVEIVRDDALELDRSLDGSAFNQRTGYSAPSWPELVMAMKAFG